MCCLEIADITMEVQHMLTSDIKNLMLFGARLCNFQNGLCFVVCFRKMISWKYSWERLSKKIERCSMEDWEKKEEIETHSSHKEMSKMLHNRVSDV